MEYEYQYQKFDGTYENEQVKDKAYLVFIDGVQSYYIVKCDTLQNWTVCKDENSEGLCAGDTLREAKEILERVLTTK